MSETMKAPAHYYRSVLRLIAGYFIGGALLVVVLLFSITDANAGYPALFFGGLFVLAAGPVCAVCAVLSVVSLMKHEPYRAAMIGVLVVSCLVAWKFLSVIIGLLARAGWILFP